MTQTPPKPNFKKIANDRSLISQSPQRETRTPSPQLVPSPSQIELLEAPKEGKANLWQNLSFRWKLSTLLIVGAALPTIGVTQGIVWYSQKTAQDTLKETVASNASGFQEDYIHWVRLESSGQVQAIADVLGASKIDLQNPAQVKANQMLLQSLIVPSKIEQERLDGWKSFRIIANAQGKTIAQFLRVHKDYSLGTAAEDRSEAIENVSLPTGIDLGNIAIVKESLRLKRPLKGIELLDRSVIQKLGLGEQFKASDANKGIKGLTAMAVEPIEVNGKVVGIAIAGVLLNRNNILVDTFREYYGSEASLYAGDLRVSTTIATADGKNRAIGDRAAEAVKKAVLDGGQRFPWREEIDGKPYLTYYLPLYDYRQDLNPQQAKPVGMLAVGTAPETLNSAVNSVRIVGYGIGLVFLLAAGAIAIPVAGTFSRPLRRLQDFARGIANGEKIAGLADTARRDEIGVLSQELDRMATKMEANLTALRQEKAREQLLKEVTLDLSQYPQVKNAFEIALEKLRIDLNVDRAFFYRFDEETFTGEVVAESVAQGLPRALGALITDPCFDNRMVEEYRRGRVQALANIYESGLADCHIKMLEAFAIRANLVVPIVCGSRGILTGLLSVNQCSESRVWQPSEIELLTQIATQFGLAIDRANLIEKTKIAAERAQALKDLTLKMSQSLESKKIFDTAVTEIRQAIRSDRVIIYQFDKNWKGTVVAESVADEFPKALGAEIADPCFADKYVQKYKQGRIQPTPDIYKAGLTECHLKQLEAFGIKANLVAPIVVGEDLLGLLIAHQCSAPRNWEPAEVDFLAQLATQVGLSLERASLLERQRQEKENLQRRALELLKEVDPVSQGDLTIRATVTEDEIGTVADSYNSTIESLRKIVGQVKMAAKQMTVTTSQNEVSVKTLSEEAVRQAQEIADALARIQSMTKSIREVTANAKQAEMVVQQASQTVRTGDVAMNRTVDGILAIRETVVETAEKVKRLGESTQKISKVIGLIGRFAAQTHMLALKASIEAARAGDEGQGFAVIADEVRILAAQSAEATAEISNLVTSIQTETNEVATAMQSGTERVAVGTKLVEETRQNLTKIAEASAQIDQLVRAIAKTANEQSQASETVSQTMNEVAAISTKTSAEATQVSNSFKELLTVAQTLQESVSKFKVE
ncbi:methyl-accepting chemotaxis protein [Pleurocapsa sp. PCC 7327]|uniref:methyl-accepting chemotaxis protein n=1 Tax=Pleurocapsa sp. PCC 7327 TaxID=118163 RepID=UPI00029FE130|nr:methyl-accepting chemotaxis protein [Pleurocapsa sp. PCC 7327]AFY77715.1 methyl-accepting chemotaxis protein [Pleurocapsa sp. PCC 7327]